MSGHVHHSDIIIQGNHLMQSHAIVVSVLATIEPILAIRESTPTATPHSHARSRAGLAVTHPTSSRAPRPSLPWVCGTSILHALALARTGVGLLGLLYTTDHNTFTPSSGAALRVES